MSRTQSGKENKTEHTGQTGQRSWQGEKRPWHAGKPIKKPNYNPDAVTEELVQAVVDVYSGVDEDNDSN